MKQNRCSLSVISLTIISLVLAACSGTTNNAITPAPAGIMTDNTPTLAATIGAVVSPTVTMAPDPAPATTEPTAATTAVATASDVTATADAPTRTPTIEPDAAPAVTVNLDGYIDNRSDPVSVLASYYNAINQHEYARAYSYWRDPAAVGDFESYQAGFVDTERVRLTVGGVSGDAGAGQLYWRVPVILVAEKVGGGPDDYFAGCFVVHLGQPSFQAAPPYRPLAIDSASVQPLSAGLDIEATLADVCGAPGERPPLLPAAGPWDVSADLYLDDHSTPEALLHAYFNAINRHEYVRAYGYWEENAPVGAYADFAAGFADTESVTIAFGDIFSGVALGNTYYDVPVSLGITTTNGAQQFFAGCYRLHLANPGAQTLPPFRPMGIQNAAVATMADAAAAAARLALGCAPAPS